MIVLDAGVLIAYLSATDAFHRAARTLIRDRGVQGLAMSAVTLAETLVHPLADDRAADLLAPIDQLRIEVIALVEADALGVAGVRAASGLRMPDAIVLHAAESTGADLATTDRRLASAARDCGIRVHELDPA